MLSHLLRSLSSTSNMKIFVTFLAILSSLSLATAVSAKPGTNAERFARGLPPLPPRRIWEQPSPAYAALKPRASPQTICPGGYSVCCEDIEPASNPIVSIILTNEGITGVGPQVPVGLNCIAVTVDVGGNLSPQCAYTPACCDIVVDTEVALFCAAVDFTIGN